MPGKMNGSLDIMYRFRNLNYQRSTFLRRMKVCRAILTDYLCSTQKNTHRYYEHPSKMAIAYQSHVPDSVNVVKINSSCDHVSIEKLCRQPLQIYPLSMHFASIHPLVQW